MQTVKSKVDLSSGVSDMIPALQNILHTQAIDMPELETPYSRASLPLNTNHPAIELNGESISAIVAERQQQLDAVLREISGLEMLPDGIKHSHQQLVKQKDKIIYSMAFHKGLVSALWRLPNEVLSEIFHHCLPEDKCLSPASNLAPMLLTRICRPWREVAVGMPSLWCRLHVKTDISRVWQEEDEEVDDSDLDESDRAADARDWRRAAFCYDSWLQRARGCPLSLVLERYPSTRLLQGLIQPYIKQISFLSIHFLPLGGVGPTHFLLKDVPELQELVVVGMGHHDILSMAEHFSQLPSTMRVLDVMDSVFHLCHISSLDLVWAHLTHVKISLRDSDAFLQLLRLCPNLSSLTARTALYERQTFEPFTHTNIQSLHLIVTCSLPHLFNVLSLPNLRMFEACLNIIQLWPHGELMAFLARSKCPLESLIVSGMDMPTDVERAEYIDLIPSLDILRTSSRPIRAYLWPRQI